jgi:hypothetical protein
MFCVAQVRAQIACTVQTYTVGNQGCVYYSCSDGSSGGDCQPMLNSINLNLQQVSEKTLNEIAQLKPLEINNNKLDTLHHPDSKKETKG